MTITPFGWQDNNNAWPASAAKMESFGAYIGAYADANFTPLVNSAIGHYVPSNWGSQWRAARSAVGSRLVTALIFGASISEGAYTSSYATKGYFANLIAALQGIYGDGGSGYMSVHQVRGLPNLAGARGGMTATGSGGATVGGWTEFDYGLNGFGLYPATAADTSSTLTATVRGTSVKIVYYPSIPPSSFTYTIDGGAPTTVNSQGSTTTLQTATSGTLSSGTHTVVITPATGQPVIEAVGGFNATGIIGHNFGAAGRPSGTQASSTSLTGTGWGTTGEVTVERVSTPDLFVLGADMAINDLSFSVAVSTYRQNMIQLCDYARAINSNCEIIIVDHHRGSVADTTFLFSQYQDATRSLAQIYGALYINMWPIYWNNYAAAAANNYWSDGTGSGLPGTNGVHPGDIGHAAIANTIKPFLTA